MEGIAERELPRVVVGEAAGVEEAEHEARREQRATVSS
jgi:hypothetical protein